MSVLNRLRGCDSFGAPISLNFNGESSFNTAGGGIASLCLKVLILTYLTMQTLKVYNFDDPQISSFQIVEDRTNMEEPMSLADYKAKFIFGMLSDKASAPV